MTYVEQVGGDHYRADYQHWDLCEECDIDYLAGNATAYIVRYDRKGTPLHDLRKAKSYLDKMMANRRGVNRRASLEAFDRFVAANNLGLWKVSVLQDVLLNGHLSDIALAASALELKIDQLKQQGETQ
ncbi:MAG: DUF3310 domain-containing protein [Cyanobacteria bacterium REEB65]|nr:DUF3310 domain-containing protein [Cyanobacteria bacterium REEB65]